MQITVRVLKSLALGLASALFIYTMIMLCCLTKFHSLLFVFPIYGLLCSVATTGILYKAEIKRKCEIEKYDEKISDLLGGQYNDMRIDETIVSWFAIFFNIFCLILILCLKCREMKKDEEIGTTVVIPIAPIQMANSSSNQKSNAQKKHNQNMIPTPNQILN